MISALSYFQHGPGSGSGSGTAEHPLCMGCCMLVVWSMYLPTFPRDDCLVGGYTALQPYRLCCHLSSIWRAGRWSHALHRAGTFLFSFFFAHPLTLKDIISHPHGCLSQFFFSPGQNLTPACGTRTHSLSVASNSGPFYACLLLTAAGRRAGSER